MVSAVDLSISRTIRKRKLDLNEKLSDPNFDRFHNRNSNSSRVLDFCLFTLGCFWVLVVGAADHPLARLAQNSEMTVGVLEVEGD